jgi:hypothetical protein
VQAQLQGGDGAPPPRRRSALDWIIAAAAITVLLWAAREARAPELAVAMGPALLLIVLSLALLVAAGGLLWRTTRLR